MSPTKDQTWRKHMEKEEIHEEFALSGYKMVLITVRQQVSFMEYLYRLIVFPEGKNEPVLSLNLEKNPLSRTCCLGAHISNSHDNLGFADENMTIEDFRSWAVGEAKKYLKLSNTTPYPNTTFQFSKKEDNKDTDGLGKRLETLPENYCGLYTSAKDLDELLIYAGEPISIAAASLMFTLDMPKKGGLTLSILKHVRPNSYNKFWDKHNNVFAQCLIAILMKLKKLLNDWENIFLSPKRFNEFAIYSLMRLQLTLKMDQKEKEMSLGVLKEALSTHEINPPRDESDQIQRIIGAFGQEPQKKNLLELIKKLDLEDPLYLMDINCFINEYKTFVQ